MDISSIIRQLPLEEKARLCAGEDWCMTVGQKQHGIPSVLMSDGPYGLRKKDDGDYQTGEFHAKKATCFPTESAMASSRDIDLLEEIGSRLGDECRAEQVSLLMGPGINIKRSPLCGRNFEYFSEDPYLAGKLACAYIHGLQSKGVGACLKHFACNNQETRRMSADSRVDERTLREIYLANFEIAVKQSRPATMMCGYNRLNGKYCCENKRLLSDILRDEWGYEGFVMTDWGAMNRRVESLYAGLDMEMPYSGPENGRHIIEAVQSGVLDETVLDRSVERILRVILQLSPVDVRCELDYDKQHRHVCRIASECMVLLKNDDRLLPLAPAAGRIALIGAFAESIRFQGGGSAAVNPYQLDQVIDILRDQSVDFAYEPGYRLDDRGRPDWHQIRKAAELAAQCSVAVVLAGLTDDYETECYDRGDLKMPPSHVELIRAVTAANSNTVVVLCNGSPVDMEWESNVKAILEAYLGGQGAAAAIVDILLGKVNPSGKLAETFPLRLQDTPAFPDFAAEQDSAQYNEGIFVGYRHYDTRGLAVRYPFGHGLSYTTFSYSDMRAQWKEGDAALELQVQLRVRNTGTVAGKEVVQLYVHRERGAIPRPESELKGFAKVLLQPGEETTVSFVLNKRSFAYYDISACDWLVEDGCYELRACASSRDIRLITPVDICWPGKTWLPVQRNTIYGDIRQHPQRAALLGDMMTRYAPQILAQYTAPSDDLQVANKRAKMLEYMPIWVVHLFSEGSLPENILDEYIDKMNAL